jgi:hypothetical protein
LTLLALHLPPLLYPLPLAPQYDMRWWCLLIVAAHFVFNRITSILVLRYKSFLKR